MAKSKQTRLPRSLARLLILALVSSISACALLPNARAAQEQGPSRTMATSQSADDAVKRAILAGPQVPRTIFEVRQRLLKLGGKFDTHIVANRGHDNPEAGSFSFFETYTGPMQGGNVRKGELFIGYFSERQQDTLVVQQSFEPSLMIELIAWDYTKQCYNFWELIGSGKTSEWHYRGDSNDIQADIAQINVRAAKPAFGSRLRCSGCHTQGGPIMKELDAPNNDWWTAARKLELGTMRLQPGSDPNSPANLAAMLFSEAKDASNLSAQVKTGINRLVAARSRQAQPAQSLKLELRGLFGAMEMNLVSDTLPFKERSRGAIEIPQGFFVDARLADQQAPIRVNTALYTQALKAAGSRFAPDEASGLQETHHAFLVPARSYIDQQIIGSLVQRGLLDDELVADVLAVDFTTPVYSRARASLIRYAPDQAQNAADLRNKLIASLRKAPADPAAQELLSNLSDPTRTTAFHRSKAIAYLDACRTISTSPSAVLDWVRIASQRRQELIHAETSRNPRGMIVEPGFRVIFPVDNLNSKPGQLRLDPASGLAAPGA